MEPSGETMAHKPPTAPIVSLFYVIPPSEIAPECVAREAIYPLIQFQRIYLVPLKEIFFYQDYVASTFMDGQNLSGTIQALESGKLTLEDLPLIEARHYKGIWYGMGNRRLACYHYVYRNEPIKMIPVLGFTLTKQKPCFRKGMGIR